MPKSDTKRCPRCTLVLPLDAFSVHRAHSSGRSSVCRACDRARKGYGDAAVIAAVAAGGETLAAFGDGLERTCAEALVAAGSVEAAAAKVQLTPSALRAHLSELRRKAARRGWSPGDDMAKVVPEGFSVKGVSSYYRVAPDGQRELAGQWVKSKAEHDHQIAALLDGLSHLADAWRGKAAPVARPKTNDRDLLAIYPIGDAHVGMHSWGAETGINHDLATAERDLCAAVDHLVALAPPAEQALVVSVGDFFHADNRASTTTNGTPVDSDARWPKVVAVGLRVMRRTIDQALTKHKRVTVICEMGNHDWHTSIVLATALSQFYEREPRVTIDTSPAKFHWYRFGLNLIGVTHGDTVKLQDLVGVMACDRAEDWGATRHRYWLTGHIHHDTVKELQGCTVESFRTLAPSDAWHKSKGYRSGRDMKLLIHHREHGQIKRYTVGIAQLIASMPRSASGNAKRHRGTVGDKAKYVTRT